MAKGQKRSTREIKKPKQPKAAPAAPASFQKGLSTPSPSKKKS
jgi:hypothetical protein